MGSPSVVRNEEKKLHFAIIYSIMFYHSSYGGEWLVGIDGGVHEHSVISQSAEIAK